MAARLVLLLAALVAAACSSGGSSATPAATLGPVGGSPAASAAASGQATAGQATAAPTDGLATEPAATPEVTQGGGGGNLMSLRPSGAKLRIVNLYRDASGKGTDLDVYGDFDASNAPKLVTVPYGTVTEFFDPGMQDDSGNADWTFYPAGKTGTDDQIGMQTETLKSSDRITLAIATGENKSQNGTMLGRWKTFFETSVDFPLPTASTAADAVLMVDGIGLAAMPASTETFVYEGVDGTCLPNVDQGPDAGGQPWGPGSQQNYLFPAGSHVVSVNLGQPDCKAKSPYPDTTVDLRAGARAFLFYYTPDDKTLKALLVPVP